MPSLMVDIGANVAMIQKDLAWIQREMNLFSRETERTFKAIGSTIKGALGAIGVGLSLGEIKNQVLQLAQAYGEQQMAETRLQAVLAAHGVANKAVTKAYADLAAGIQNTTTYTDDQVLSAMKILTVMGTAPSQIKPATDAVLMLASAFGMDLDSAAKLVGQAMEGNTERLGRIIPALKGVERGAMSAAEVFDLLRGSIGDIAAQEAETYIGKMKRLENQYGELKEMLGSAIVPTLSEFLESNIARLHRMFGLLGDNSLAWNKKELQLIDKEMKAIQSGAQLATDLIMEGGAFAPGEDRMAVLLEARKKVLVDIGTQEAENKKLLSQADKAFVKPKVPQGAKGETDAEERARRKTLEALTAQYKEFYQNATLQADHYVEMQKLAGVNELNFWFETYDKKTTALDEWYDAQGAAIEKYVRNAEEKQAALSKLDAEYAKQHEVLDNKFDVDQVKSIEFQKKNYSSMLSWDRKQAADQLAFDRSMAGERVKIDAETYDLMMTYKKLFRKDAEILDKDYLKTGLDKYKETFVGGWKTGLKEITDEQRAWGNVMYETAKGLHSAMSRSFSDVFYDAVTGKLKNLQDYFTDFSKSLLRTFTDEVGKKISQQIIKIMLEANWTQAGTSALGVMDKALGYLGITSDLQGSASDFIDLMNADWGGWYAGGRIPYGSGGRVAGMAGFSGDHPGNDTVPAWLSPGEFVVPRSAVNSDTLQILEYIRNMGRVPYAVGGLVKGVEVDFQNQEGGDWFQFYDSAGHVYVVPSLSQLGKNSLYGSITQGIASSDEFGITYGDQTYAGGDPYDPADLARAIAEGTASGAIAYSRELLPSSGFGGVSGFAIGATNKAHDIVSDALGWVQQNILTDAFWRTVIPAAAGYVIGSAAGTVISGAMAPAGAAGTAGSTAGLGPAGTGGGIFGGSFGATAEEIAKKMGISILRNNLLRFAIGETLGRDIAGGIKGGSLSLGLGGASAGDYSALGNLGGILGKEYSFSARNGLDYVPWDNFPIRAHAGEAVLDKEDAAVWRGGGSITLDIQIPVVVDGKEIDRLVAKRVISGGELLRAIDNRIKVVN